MTTSEWKQFQNTASKEKFFDAYFKFMYDKSNIRNCENCPMNDGFDDWQDRLPCGQFHCWVTIHCHRN